MTDLRFDVARLALAVACTFGAAAANAATVAYYTFENGTYGEAARGKGAIQDSSGNGLNGNPFGGPKYDMVSNPDNPDSTLAMKFDGKTTGIWVPDSPLLQLTHSLTLEGYVYVGRNRTGGCVVCRSDNRYAFDPYYLSVFPGNILAFLIDAGLGQSGSLLTSPTPLPMGEWLHVAGTLDDATGLQSLYINGTLVASTFTTLRPFAKLAKHAHAGLAIGSGVVGSPDMGYLNGRLDSVRISDVALEPAQFLPPP